MSNPPSTSRRLAVELAVMLLLLTGVLATLLHGVFTPNHTLFSNDGPLGRLISDCHKLPDRFTGCWSDLNSIGGSGGASPTGISLGLLYLLKPIWFSKLYALVSLTILGVGAWCFFTQLRLAPAACVLGGLAAVLFVALAWAGWEIHSVRRRPDRSENLPRHAERQHQADDPAVEPRE